MTTRGRRWTPPPRRAAGRPRLSTARGVMAAIVPPARNAPPPARVPDGPAADDAPQPMARLINRALAEALAAFPEVVLAGEDIGAKGGVYGVTRGLQGRFGRDRVIDTVLDEQSILGLGLGMAHNGLLPVPEIQFLAYLHNAADQIRGEAATLPFFSNGQFANPMVVRIAGLGYQKGFGGHFHNDNALGALRDIPGLIVACPSDGAEAVRLFREALRLAREENRVVVFLEPIALYPQRDLHDGDGGWLRSWPPPDDRAALGSVAVTGDGTDLAIVTYGNGVRLAAQAARGLGADVRIVDLRWLAPLPAEALMAAVRPCARVLIVDECRRSGNVSEGLMTLFAEAGGPPAARVTAEDSFIATGPAHAATLPSRAGIAAAARRLLG